jgi:hypothetical protein
MMIEVAKNVFVGDDAAYEYGWKVADNWAHIRCCKEKGHRQFVGYTTRGCPRDDPEYYYAMRDNAIALNMVDVDSPEFFDKSMMQMGIAFAIEHSYKKLLFSCNKGESRAPSMAMLYLAIIGRIPQSSFLEAEDAFKKLYPAYNPKNGIRTYLKMNWKEYMA